MNKLTAKKRGALLGAGMLALAGTLPSAASATIILDTTVTGQFNPYATATGTAGNDLPGKPGTLYYGQLKASTAGLVDFYYIGHEAGYTNTFVYGDSGNLVSGSGSFNTAGKADNFNPNYSLLGSISVGAGSFLDFGFCTSGGSNVNGFGKCAANDSAASLKAQYNYNTVGGYRSIGYVPLTGFDITGLLGFTPGTGPSDLWSIWWDDSGARNDDNHDDMVIVAKWRPLTSTVVSVPEPGVLGLFSLGLLGGVIALRGRRSEARR